MKKQERHDHGAASRRRFLKTVAASGGAVAVTAGAGKVLAYDPDSGDGSDAVNREKQGYRETQHIREYYARADF